MTHVTIGCISFQVNNWHNKQSTVWLHLLIFFDRGSLNCVNLLNTDGNMNIAFTKGESEYQFGRDRKCLISFIVFIIISNLIQADDSDLYSHIQKEQKNDTEKLFDWKTDFVIILQVKVHLETYSEKWSVASLFCKILYMVGIDVLLLRVCLCVDVCMFKFNPLE